MKEFLETRNQKLLRAYAELPSLIKEHHGIEQTVLAGGYGYRQILELVQNGADAILEAHENCTHSEVGNRIHVWLRESYLYVANTGASLSEDGVDALLSSHSSPKRGNQIGRFGLGFKSLLRLGGPIDIFTKASGAIRFDPERCAQEFRSMFDVPDAAGLRQAWPLDEIERCSDAALAHLDWAETIVRINIRTAELLEHLRVEIRAFPAEFLLFFPVPTTLLLEDGEKPKRELRTESNSDQYVLHDGDEKSTWHVTKWDATISDERALADATHIHARTSVPLAWAVPLEGKREEAGRFWAFFPTHTPTYLPGILNAPWKLNSDRNAIIGGEWNSALMTEAAALIVNMLPKLSTPEDPALPLEAFPRQMDRKDEDAGPLVEALWKSLESATVIPDDSGTLRQARALWRHPRDSVQLALQWQALPANEDTGRYVHPSCLERYRSSRLNALAERINREDKNTSEPNLRRNSVSSWFEVVASKDIARTIRVLELAEAYADECNPQEWNTVRSSLAIILSQDGCLMTASQVVFAPDEVIVPGRATVASVLYNNNKVRNILMDVMRVQTLDDGVWMNVLRESLNIPNNPPEAQNASWMTLWARMRLAPPIVRERFIRDNQSKIRVRRRDGSWVMCDEALLPGTLISPDDTSHQNLLVDMKLHGSDSVLLSALGVTDFPDGNEYRIEIHPNDELSVWLSVWRESYKKTYQNAALREYLKPIELTMPKGFRFLPRLHGTPNARLTKKYLARILQGDFPEQLKFGHCTTSSYPKIEVLHPLPWFVLKFGMVQIGDEVVRLAAIVVRSQEPALAILPILEHVLPVIEKFAQTNPHVAPAPDDICALWLALINLFATPAAVAQGSLEDLWSGAARDNVVPETIRAPSGEIPITQVFVTGSPDLARRVRSEERIVITLDESAFKLWVSKGALNLSALLNGQAL
jgi:hypothetical protein